MHGLCLYIRADCYAMADELGVDHWQVMFCVDHTKITLAVPADGWAPFPYGQGIADAPA